VGSEAGYLINPPVHGIGDGRIQLEQEQDLRRNARIGRKRDHRSKIGYMSSIRLQLVHAQ